MAGWLRRVLRRRPSSLQGTASEEGVREEGVRKHSPGEAGIPEALWVIQPPDGVRLVSSRPSRTGEGGQGIVARYSDGTTASAMVNSDGSLLILFFQGNEMLPAVPLDEVGPPRYTWEQPHPRA